MCLEDVVLIVEALQKAMSSFRNSPIISLAQWFCITVYQSPLLLTKLFQHSLINVSYLTACYLCQVMMTLHFLNDVANDAESTQKSKVTS